MHIGSRAGKIVLLSIMITFGYIALADLHGLADMEMLMFQQPIRGLFGRIVVLLGLAYATWTHHQCGKHKKTNREVLMKAVFLFVIILSGCATVRHEIDVGGGKTAVYVTYRDSRQEGYNQTCRDIWQDGKFVEGKCAQGPSLLQSTTAGSTSGALGAYLRRPDRFENHENISNSNQQEQGQHQGQHQRQRQHQDANPMITINTGMTPQPVTD